MKFKTKSIKLFRNELQEAMPFRVRIYLLALITLGLTVTSVAHSEELPLQIEKIECEGNTRTECKTLIQESLLSVGDVVEEEKTADARSRLLLLGNYDDVNLRLGKGTEVGKVVLMLAVQERSPFLAVASAGYVTTSANHYAVFDVTGADLNLTGHHDSLALRVRDYSTATTIGDTSYHESDKVISSTLEYTRPSFLFPRMTLIAGLGIMKSSFTEVGDPYLNQLGFTQHNTDVRAWGHLLLSYQVGEYTSLTAGYRRTKFLQDSAGAAYIVPNYGMFDPSLPNSYTFLVQYARDSQDNINFPTQGSRIEATVERNHFDHRYYFSGLEGTQVYLSGLFHVSVSDRDIFSLKLGRSVGTDSNIDRIEDKGVSLRYSNYFKRHQTGQTIQNAKWYVEPGLFESFWGSRRGAKIGATFQTNFGIINLFFAGTN